MREPSRSRRPSTSAALPARGSLLLVVALSVAALPASGCAHGGQLGERPSPSYPSLSSVLARLIWPLRFESRRNVRSAYGYRAWGGGAGRYHYGLDLAARRRDPVYGAGDGIVVEAGSGGAYGRFVRLEHGHELSSLYAHLDEVLVRAGEHVRRGQVIGLVGSTGNATGPHLHFELRWRGRWVDPFAVLPGLE